METDKSTAGSGCITPPPSETVLPPGRGNGRGPSSKQWLAVIAMIVAIFGVAWLMHPAGSKEATTEVIYNAEAVHAQDRIAAWLGEPDTAEREMLRSWLAERGIEGSETSWLVSASQEELDAAIDDLRIPECEN